MIAAEELQLLLPEVVSDYDEGGGRLTATALPDASVGAVFDKISRAARAGGEVSLRKIGLAVRSATTDALLGAGLLLTDAPSDEHVSVVAFSTGAAGAYDRRPSARTYLENYVVAGPEYQGFLYGPHTAGSLSLSLLQRVEAALPEVGQVYALRVGTAVVQYVRVTDVTSITVTFTDSLGDFTRRQVTIKLASRLSQDYAGGTPTRYSVHDSPTRILTTSVQAAARYYGVEQLAAPATAGALSVLLRSVYVQVVPSATRQTAVSDATVGGAVAVVSGGSISGLLLWQVYMASSTATVYLPRGVVSGSVVLTVRARATETGSYVTTSGVVATWVYTDDGNGTLSKTGGTSPSTPEPCDVDYELGQVSFVSPGIYPYWEFTLSAQFAASIEQTVRTLSIPVTLATRSQVYAPLLDPLPAPGTVTVSFAALGRWYTLRDNGSGVLVPDLDGTGTGTVTYATGGTAITLGALPDVGSAVIVQWGTPTDYVDHHTDSISPAEIRVQLPAGGLDAGSVAITWYQGGVAKTVTDNGAGGWTGSAGSAPSGATGCDLISGLLRVVPAALPDVGSVLHVEYQQSAQVGGTLSAVRVGSTLSGTLPAGLRAGTLRLSVTVTAYIVLTKLGYPDKRADDTFEVVLRDDGSGGFTADTSGVTVSGAVDYATGEWSATISGSVMRTVYGHTHWAAYALAIIPESLTPGSYLAEQSTEAYGAQVYETTLSGLTLDLTPTHAQAVVPGSLMFNWGGLTWIDRSGSLLHSVSPATGAGVIAGSIDYDTGLATIDSWSAGGDNSVTLKALLTSLGEWTMVEADFRAPGAPLLPGSLYVQATRADGTLLSATAGTDGTISGEGISGTVSVASGVVHLDFVSEGGTEYRQIMPGTLRYSCVVVATVPQDADLIGVDATRLPSDGRVPIYRAGGDELVLIHETLSETMPSGLTAGQVVTLAHSDLQALELRDQAGVQVPYALWSADLIAGTVTMADPLDLSAYTQPLIARCTVGDLCSVTDVMVDGSLTLGSALSRDYPAGARCSSMLRFGALQARVSVLFDQSTWDGVTWLDAVSGSSATATFNSVTYPVVVTNRDAISERWALKFTSSTAYQIIGETIGVVGTGTTSADCAPLNPYTGQPYFRLLAAGFGSGWAAGNVIRVNTIGAHGPAWLARCVSPGAEALAYDDARLLGWGDV